MVATRPNTVVMARAFLGVKALPVIWVGKAPWVGGPINAVVHSHRAGSVMLLPDCLEVLVGQPQLAIRDLGAVTCPDCQALLVARYLQEEG